MTRSEVVHIAVASDAAYISWAATLVQSCLQQHSVGRVHFHLLHDSSLSARDGSRLLDMVHNAGSRIDLYDIDPSRVSALPSVNRFGHIVWLRFLLPELLPDLSRVLYLDADTFVVDSPEPLWHMDLEGDSLGAVANVVEPVMRDHVAGLGIEDGKGFFNSGVLLMDLDRMREDNSAGQLAQFASEQRGNLVWPDQDALNIVFAGRWHPLHPRWNAMNSLWFWGPWARDVFGRDAVREATTEPAILHFEGPSLLKPWHFLCQHPWRDEYRRTLASTPWAGTPLEDQTPATQLIRRLPTRMQLPVYRRLVRMRVRS